MYWYYYSGSRIESAGSSSDADPLRYARIRAASQWMHNASSDKGYKNASVAKMYADIADFNTQIVPLINEGNDAGKYKPYFTKLVGLVDSADQEDNDVIRLEASNLALDALRVYPRKFRADGIGQRDMADLARKANDLAVKVEPTTDAQDKSQQEAVEAYQPTIEAVNNAFVDVKGDAK